MSTTVIDMKNEARCSGLRNRFFVIRHGQSEANVKGLIASSPDIAIDNYGLTNLGRDQVVQSVHQVRDLLIGARIITSDFKRARETAELVADALQSSVEESTAIRERGFGQWDGMSDENYQLVWSADANDPSHQQWGVESVVSVARRMRRVVSELDCSCKDETFILVSHGDPLQILITSMNEGDLRHHRNLDPLGTADLRPLCQPD